MHVSCGSLVEIILDPMKRLLIVLFGCFALACTKEGLQENNNFYGYEGDSYNTITENPFIETSEENVSTFSIDVDGASYSNARRILMEENRLPPLDAIRTEEFINYFDFPYEHNSAEHPIDVNGEVSLCPWDSSHKLVRIGIAGKYIPDAELPSANYVFLIDVSGSMSNSDKLPLLKKGLIATLDQMRPEDRVAIVAYAGADRVHLESTPVSQKETIKQAISSLGAGGSTAGGAGIKKAYEIAENHKIVGGNNRVILGTDGDFNVGISSQEELLSLIEEKRESGIFLTVLGFGMGNVRHGMLEQIANHGNGNYEYIDSEKQLERVFIDKYASFFTIAKDVKVQAIFNASIVKAYRLIGYENRLLDNGDFEDDSTDAGELGVNQKVTALYEIEPVVGSDFKNVPSFSILFRYKQPDEHVSKELSLEIYDQGNTFAASTGSMKLASAVASFALQLRDSPYKGNTSYSKIREWVSAAGLPDSDGSISEFITLTERAEQL